LVHKEHQTSALFKLCEIVWLWSGSGQPVLFMEAACWCLILQLNMRLRGWLVSYLSSNALRSTTCPNLDQETIAGTDPFNGRCLRQRYPRVFCPMCGLVLLLVSHNCFGIHSQHKPTPSDKAIQTG
jgi:hypothetical protein